MMNVGLLREKHKTGILGRTLTYICKYYDINFFVFTYVDIDLETQTIEGLFYKNGKWQKEKTGFPEIVDNVPMDKRKYPAIFKALKATSIMTTPGLGSKSVIFNKMKASQQFDDVLIPYQDIETYEDLKIFLQQHSKVVIKPTLSSKGKNIAILERINNKIQLSTDTQTWSVDEEGLRNYFTQNIEGKTHVAQPFIQSQTKEGFPFDIRLHVRKNSRGIWKKVEIYPRIGIGKHITSNVNQGGGVTMITPFLTNNFGEMSHQLKQQLNVLCEQFPPKFEQLYNFDIDALGIDIGIEPDGKIWLFEVNTFPGQHFFYAKDSEMRVAYYRYLLRQK